jgi:hypothetical protein
MKKCTVFAVVIFLTVHYVYGQEKNKLIPVNISYFGETIVHPGIVIGYENTFFRSFNFTVSMGTYLHKRNHTGLFWETGINWRHTFPIGYSMEFGLGLGYLHTWEHGGDIYMVDGDGNVSIEPKYGHPHFMPSVKLGLLGWVFRKKTEIPLRLNADIIIFGQYPFNNYMLPHAVLKAGGTYYFSL